jgi:ketosteroid isomerase-like protein
MSVQQDSLAVIVAWLDAMRRADLQAVTELFPPDVVWRGVPADAICHVPSRTSRRGPTRCGRRTRAHRNGPRDYSPASTWATIST